MWIYVTGVCVAFIKNDAFSSANLKSKIGSRFMRAKILKGGVDISFKNQTSNENYSTVNKKLKNKIKVFQNL